MFDTDGTKEDQTVTIREDPALEFGTGINDDSRCVDDEFGWQLKVVDSEARPSFLGLGGVKDVEGLFDAHIVDEEGRVVTVIDARETAARVSGRFGLGEQVEGPIRVMGHDVDLARHVLEIGRPE